MYKLVGFDGPVSIDRRVPARSGAKGGSKPALVCFSHLRWDFVYQRPQHLLARATRDFDVWFVEEPMFSRDCSASLQIIEKPEGVRVVVPQLPAGLDAQAVLDTQTDLIELLSREIPSEGRVLWFYTPMALAICSRVERSVVVYDNMDELSAFRGAPAEMLLYEELLLSEADVVFTGGLSLYEAKRGRHSNLHAFPSSIDSVHFGQARGLKTYRASDVQTARCPKVGFFGVIDERMDLELVDAVAALRPDWSFEMVGPVVKIDPSTLPKRDNIHWAGPCAYSDLPQKLAGWDIGFMPFAINESTRFISPTKTPEFLAAGLPVVSTPIVDVVRTYGERNLVEIADSPEGVVRAVEALVKRPYGAWLEAADRFLAGTSWKRTWDEMYGLISQLPCNGTAALERPFRERAEPKSFDNVRSAVDAA